MKMTSHAMRRRRERFPDLTDDAVLAALPGEKLATHDNRSARRLIVGEHPVVVVVDDLSESIITILTDCKAIVGPFGFEFAHAGETVGL